MTEVSTNEFAWDPKERVFSAEASRLPGDLSSPFTLVSARTGEGMKVHLTRTKRDREGDVQFWEFRPYEAKFRDLFTVVVFND